MRNELKVLPSLHECSQQSDHGDEEWDSIVFLCYFLMFFLCIRVDGWIETKLVTPRIRFHFAMVSECLHMKTQWDEHQDEIPRSKIGLA